MRPAVVLGAVAGLVAAGAALLGLRQRAADRTALLAAVDVDVTCPDARALGPACGRCVAAFCCAEMQACYGSSDCIDLNDCYVRSGEDEGQGGSPRTRAEACLAQHPGKRMSFLAWDSCARNKCEDVCLRGPEQE
jgi:hypothetical protein